MQLSEHFTLEELIFSQTAARWRIDNAPPDKVMENLKILAGGLERIRSVLGHPIIISSGYRSRRLNALVAGSKHSAHMLGLAADFHCPAFGTPLEICRAVAQASLGIDQIIYEGTWCHVAFPAPGTAARNELLTAHFDVGGVRYSEGLIAG